ncbi:EpsG family protein [Flavobacterium solisilvae]|uniref:EpsG family protein n=1 Tax=Flavobacterium solisilvae TaxID=1852019 RepID=A0ABX1QWL1_9FLAO|nr:EpsG family protein [Flavobacterium solisilvae]NMH25347.1 hypothetical protein [Flavobacterium solisilvae]
MNKKIAGSGFPLFFLLPIAGFLTSLFDIKSKTSAFVYVAFATLFGYAISFSDSSADSYRYAEAFARFDNTLDYDTIVKMYRNGELRDTYQLLLFYFTSIFSDNPKVMYAFAGLVYGVFSYLNLRIFVKEQGNKWDKYTFVLALVFFTYISLANINGFRFWTGALVLFYAVYNCIILKKTRWIIGIMVAPLFHYGFMLIMPVLILYRFVHPMLYNSKRVNPILLYMFIIAFGFSWVLKTNSINLTFLTSYMLSGEVVERIDYVNSEEIANLVEGRKETSLFLNVQQYFDYGIKIYVFVAVLFLNRLIKRMKGDKTIYTNLFAFVLFFYAFAFLASSVPSGSRFFDIAHLFLFVLLVKFYAIYKTKSYQNLILWSLPVFAFNIAFINGMLPLMILTPTFWYGNVFWIIIEGIDFYV